MVANGSTVDWQQSQNALRDEVRRVTALLRSVRDPGAPAVGQWNLAETAMHLSQVWIGVPAMVRQDLSPVYEVLPSIASVAGKSLIRDLWELGDLMVLAVKSDPERDLAVLADRIEERAEEYFDGCAGHSPDELRSWMVEGTTLPLWALTGHLLNETLLHGYDIARADGRTWRIEPAHAAMVLERFFIPATQQLNARALVNGSKAADIRATYDIRIRGGESFHFIFDDGELTIAEPSDRSVDCHISADPVAFLMVVWNRQSQWPAIATGKLMAWGRKPWLGFQLRSLMRNP